MSNQKYHTTIFLITHLQAKLVLHVDVVHVRAVQKVLRQQRRVAQALHRAVDVARVAQIAEPHQAVPDLPFVVRGRLWRRGREGGRGGVVRQVLSII